MSLVSVANALHWMNTSPGFTQVYGLIRPGGGIAVLRHRLPFSRVVPGIAMLGDHTQLLISFTDPKLDETSG